MIDQFNMSNIRLFQSLDYKFDVAADFTNPETISAEKAQKTKNTLNDMGVRVFDIAIPRLINPSKVYHACQKVKNLINSECYELIHCHSPLGGFVTRVAARKNRKTEQKLFILSMVSIFTKVQL